MLERDCPYFMSIGMTYEQYWHGEPRMARAYYQAEKIRMEQRDADAWLIGAYVANAIDSIVGNHFRQKGATPAKYPDMPELTKKRLERVEREKKTPEEQDEQDAMFAKAYMKNMARMGKNWGKKG